MDVLVSSLCVNLTCFLLAWSNFLLLWTDVALELQAHRGQTFACIPTAQNGAWNREEYLGFVGVESRGLSTSKFLACIPSFKTISI